MLGLTGILYVLGGRVGLELAIVHASAVWPATGIAIGMMLLVVLRVWSAVLVGAALFNFQTSGDASSSIIIALGNTLEGVATVWMIERFAGGRDAFSHFRNTLLFGIIVATAATLASVGLWSLVNAGVATHGIASTIWTTLWLGDLAGVAVATPLVVFAASSRAWSNVNWGHRFATFAVVVPGSAGAYFLNAPSPIALAFSLLALSWPVARLGLYVRQAITQAHGGSITIETTGLGQGTTVHVMLPLVASRPEKSPELKLAVHQPTFDS